MEYSFITTSSVGTTLSQHKTEIEREIEGEKSNTMRTMVVQTFEEITRNYTKEGIDGADQAKCLYVIMGPPSTKAFKLMLKNGLLLNNSVMTIDYRNAFRIYGEDLGSVKGKTVKRKTKNFQ